MACRQCWDDHPKQSWCNGHQEFHPVSVFNVNRKRPEGLTECCRAWLSDNQYRYRHNTDFLPRNKICQSCGAIKHQSAFYGSINKRTVCKECTDSHHGHSWCVGCLVWAPLEWFDIPSRGRPMSWCALCWALRNHNTTIAQVLSIQGSSVPECAVCFQQHRRLLNVDHDHRCCPGERSCGQCVRGLLCRTHNRVEGLLVTSENAARMLDYMVKADKRWAVRNEVK